jgi:hypothetical protein
VDYPENDLSDSALLIKSRVSEKEAKKNFQKSRNPSFKLYYELDSNKLFAYELNGNNVHATIVMEFSAQFWNYARADGNRLVVNHGLGNYGGRMINADQSISFIPTTLPTPPTSQLNRLILQVGYTESVASLHSHADHLLAGNTEVQVYIFIKIWKRRVDLTRAICVAIYQRGQPFPRRLISVGDAAPTPHFLQFFQNRFPNQEIPEIENFDIVPANTNLNLFSFSIPGAWILPEVTPMPADLVIDCSRMARIIKFM